MLPPRKIPKSSSICRGTPRKPAKIRANCRGLPGQSGKNYPCKTSQLHLFCRGTPRKPAKIRANCRGNPHRRSKRRRIGANFRGGLQQSRPPRQIHQKRTRGCVS